METLVLTSPEVSSLVSQEDALDAMQRAFKAHGDGPVEMPAKVYLDLARFHGDLRAMPAYIENLKVCGMKWVNSHPDNLIRNVLPAVMAILIINDPETGFPLAIMDATIITRMRTGAAGALASRYLARADSRVLSLAGAGVQAHAQLESHLKIFKFSEVRVWSPKRDLSMMFKEKFKNQVPVVLPCDTLDECVRGCDILCTTTPSRSPLVRREWIGPGVHINAIGADAKGKQECDGRILKDAWLVVDDVEQAIHGGEVNVPFSQGLLTVEDIDATLGEIVSGRKPARRSGNEITVFDSTGIAIQDIALGKVVYERAVQKGVGQKIRFF